VKAQEWLNDNQHSSLLLSSDKQSIYFRRYHLIPLTFCFALFVLTCAVPTRASTGYSNEISNIKVQSVTPTSVEIVWDTLHPSTSQVVIARDTDYQGERRIPLVPDTSKLVNHHRVTVDHLMPYDATSGLGSYYFYVASTDVNQVLSTAPGPYDSGNADPSTKLLPFQTAAPDPNKQSNATLYTQGPMNVYAGSDLYFGIQIAQLAGAHNNFYIHNYKGYNNGSDGVVRAVGAARGKNPETISVHFSCFESNPNNDDSYDQYHNLQNNMGECWSGYYYETSVRVRTSRNTAPGNYSVLVTLDDNGQNISTLYYFAVLPAPGPPAPRNSYPPPIPGKSTWESYMTLLGHTWCDNLNNGSSRDSLNAQGNFLTGWGWEQDAWYYDGGRVYQEIESYTNDPSWDHCALTLLDPYRQWILANNAAMPLHSIFAYGMEMNYWRTGDTTNSDALQYLATKNGGANYGGWVDPFWIRETAYMADVRIANELITSQRDRLLAKNIDKLLGDLDVVYMGRLGPEHPFMVGLALETAIHYYDMTVAENHPDYRVPPMVKRAIDSLWRDYYVPSTHAFRFTRWDMPTIDNWMVLNNLVAPAYAWYWNLTGDPLSLSRGDDLFQHEFDVPGDVTWSGKQFSQTYKWSFDFVRWRSGENNSAVFKGNNFFSGPYADTEPPIETNVAVSNITDTTATISWTTYEPASSQIIYGTADDYYPLKSALYDSGSNGKTSHSVTLTGLTPNLTYHYRVQSVDQSNNLAALQDATFTTTAGSQNYNGPGNFFSSGNPGSGKDSATPRVGARSGPVVNSAIRKTANDPL